ncbi:MAG TPA: homoserine dehydrogenase [Acidobacteria bacterium]|nr:homoserine dehydrogenase [Acidobacteriota bacterium]
MTNGIELFAFHHVSGSGNSVAGRADHATDRLDNGQHDPYADADLLDDVAKNLRVSRNLRPSSRTGRWPFFVGREAIRAEGKSMKVMRVAILGFGTVGQSVAKILVSGRSGLQLTRVFNRNVERKQVEWIPDAVDWTEKIDEVFTSDVDVVVELIGGLDPAGPWIQRALMEGKSVVTANKQVIANDGARLSELAVAKGVCLNFEAAVAGVVPIISSIRNGLIADNLYRIRGVLNGTCNFLLTTMGASEASFDEVLADAQERGYAEADPSADLDGVDAQAKLSILSAIGLKRLIDPNEIACRSIRGVGRLDFEVAGLLGCGIRQVSTVELTEGVDGVRAEVGPAMVELGSRVAQVSGNENVVVVDGISCGEVTLIGQGAGGDPTAVAIVSDLLAIASGTGAPNLFPSSGPSHQVGTMGKRLHYVRVTGAQSAARILSGLGMEATRTLKDAGDQVRFVTGRCTTEAVESALKSSASTSGDRAENDVVLPIID